MSVNDNILKEEEKYLTDVKKVAKKLIDEIDVKITKEKQEIFELKKYIWNDCKSLSELEYGNLLKSTIKNRQFKTLTEQGYLNNLLKHYENYKKIPTEFYENYTKTKNKTNIISFMH